MIHKRPYCHGEPMQPSYRYLGEDGHIYITYICNLAGCDHKEEVIVE
jgi:hypothetical protein